MDVEIIIVDNDSVVCALSQELLQDAGFSTLILQDSRRVMQTIKELKPRAVLLDIMMPGIDGLTLCRAIKADPEIKDTKIIIISGKAFSVEKDRALRYGTDLFLQKPYDIHDFKSKIIETVGQPTNPKAGAGISLAAREKLKVRVWGSRSLPEAPGKLPEGVHTPCVSVETSEHFFIFDAGSGLIPLGQELLKEAERKEAWIFLTHFHPAHIEGLGLFALTRVPGTSLHIAGPNDPEKSLEECIRDSFQQSFLLDPKPIVSKMQLYVFQEGDYDLLPGVRVSTFYTNHPTTTLGYRLDFAGRSLVYCPDSEFIGESATALQDYDETLGRKCRHVDLLIHNCRYNSQDYAKHKNQGHSCLTDVLDFAVAQEVDQLLLFHLDASYSAADIDAMNEQARQYLKSKSSNLLYQIAKEGSTINL